MAGRNTAGIRRQPSGSAAPRLMLRLPLSRRSALQLAAAGGGAALLAHAAPAAHGQGPSGEMIVAPPAQIVALDPHGAQSVEEVMHTALQHVMEPLVKRDPASGDLAPHLATEWSNPDETTWRFTLREGVQFHDGSPFTSEDVKASLERVIEEAGPLAPLFAQVDAIATPDETTVEIRTTSPVGTIAVSMTMVQIAPAARMNEEGFFNQPIGTGPFTVASWSPDADLRLEANADYWGDPPGVQSLVFRHYPEVAPLVTALETGEIDFTWRLPPDQLPALQGNDQITIESVPGFTYFFIWMNSSREPFTDMRVRRAMAHALDIDQMLTDLLPDVAKRGTAPIASTVFGYAAQDPYTYDPERARALLEEAGHPDGFEVGMIWNPGSAPQDRELVQTMISYWDTIGVRVNSLEMERALWIDTLVSLEWDMDFQTNATITGDADFTLRRLYHSSANRNGYKNPDLDTILEDAVATLDQDERAELYAQACEIIWSEAVGIFPFELLNVYAFQSRVSGFEPSPSPILSFANVTVA